MKVAISARTFLRANQLKRVSPSPKARETITPHSTTGGVGFVCQGDDVFFLALNPEAGVYAYLQAEASSVTYTPGVNSFSVLIESSVITEVAKAIKHSEEDVWVWADEKSGNVTLFAGEGKIETNPQVRNFDKAVYVPMVYTGWSIVDTEGFLNAYKITVGTIDVIGSMRVEFWPGKIRLAMRNEVRWINSDLCAETAAIDTAESVGLYSKLAFDALSKVAEGEWIEFRVGKAPNNPRGKLLSIRDETGRIEIFAVLR
jgi:hypothetical protein